MLGVSSASKPASYLKGKEEIMDKLWLWIAYKLPRGLVKWAAIRLMANATVGKYSDQVVPDLTAIAALKRW